MNRTLALCLALALGAVAPAGCAVSKQDGCAYPSIKCGDRCADGGSDPSNCGACGHVCGATESCCSSACVDVHGTGSAAPLVDNCGACGHRCPTGGACAAGTCACPPALPATCGASRGECVDLTIDPDNCSTCGLACNGVGATPVAACTASTCVCSGTETSFDCGGDPRCVNRLVDASNCGACGHVCQNHSTCTAGACACGGAYPTNCGTAPSPVCVNTSTDSAHCGDCTTSCIAGKACSNGNCCPTGQTWCPSASACVNTQTDPNNCGTCGHACAAGQTCSGGSCGCGGTTPRACGTHCCAGTACCSSGTACQPARSNGLGGSFYYGCDATPALDASIARAAADSWQAGIATYDPLFCAGRCLARQTSSSCAIWCYDGPYVGRVAVDTTTPSCDAVCTRLTTGQSTSWP